MKACFVFGLLLIFAVEVSLASPQVRVATSPSPSTRNLPVIIDDLYAKLNAQEAEIEALRRELREADEESVDPIQGFGLVGEIRAFATPGCPDGWLACDGTAISVESPKYSRLARELDGRWGAPDALQVNLPDLRGLFLRGWNNGSGDAALSDPDSNIASRPGSTRPGVKSAKGDEVGSLQGDQLKSHSHGGTLATTRGGGRMPQSADNWYVNDPATESAWYGQFKDWSGGGGAESRPKNVYVQYCIKY